MNIVEIIKRNPKLISSYTFEDLDSNANSIIQYIISAITVSGWDNKDINEINNSLSKSGYDDIVYIASQIINLSSDD